ncbi:hypothetical protein EJD97_018850 [Solanum chilense]|uniref:Uncharacterized protein n=1 Tax=Solanum chilense TaxID=4083 RepID=A0A6N2ADU5_SOLCI|nr:hypothetical protein EJD97_018850 [Solanum chilense]
MTQLSLRLENPLLSMFIGLGKLGDASHDVYTFPCILRTCGGMPDWRIGRKIHAYAIRFSHDSEIDIVNALITMYCSARVLFDGMSKRENFLEFYACEALEDERLGRALHGYVSRMNFNSSLIQI